MKDPLKQGLKLEFMTLRLMNGVVEVKDPLKQGLKQITYNDIELKIVELK